LIRPPLVADMTLDVSVDLDPDPEELLDAELAVVEGDPSVLVKAFALGPGATLSPHEHPGSTNVFHLVEGELVVVRGDEEERLTAPATVVNEPGVVHGARNESDAVATLTATMAPIPGT
jgi:quercetin dioxygenase-like cupin family protein